MATRYEIITSATTGDVSLNNNTATLATVNSNVGSYTNASITVNAKGLITAASTGSASQSLAYTTQTSTYAPTTTDNASQIAFTGSSAATWTLVSAVTLGAGWYAILSNRGTSQAALTLKSSAGTIDGIAAATGFIMYPEEVRLVQSDGANFHTTILQGFIINTQSTMTFYTPPGYTQYSGKVWGGGGSGGAGATNGGGGGGGGACVPFDITTTKFGGVGTSVTCTVGAGGAAQTSAGTAGNAGNSSTLGTFVTAYGGGRGGGGSGGGGGGGGGAGYVTTTYGGGTTVVSGVGGNSTTTTSGIGGASFDQPTGKDVYTSSTITALPQFAGAAGMSTGGLQTDTAYYGGGGAGSSAATTASAGGMSIYGGGGGGGASNVTGGAGGTSVYGGAGGKGGSNGAGTNGAAPGGGGGGAVGTAGSGAGGSGAIIITGII